MKSPVAQWVLFASGVILISVALISGGAPQSFAAPPAALTPTPEPPTLTAVPPTPVPTTPPPVPTTPPAATNTPVPPPSRPETDPLVEKSVTPSEAREGETVTFQVTVRGQGDIEARDVVVEDSVPGFLAILGVTASRGDVTISGNKVTVNIGTVQPGEVITINIQARITVVPNPPFGTNVAVLTTSSSSDDPSNNTATATLTVVTSSTQETPTATATATGVPSTPTATAVPVLPTVVPAGLPRTGDTNGSGTSTMLLVALGVILILLSFVVRRRSTRS